MPAERWARYARPDEAGAIVDIIRSGFPPWVIERTVYGCPGATGYVGAVIGGRPLTTPIFLVAGTSTDVLAAAEITLDGRELFLSYIATRIHQRSGGLGASLLAMMADCALAADIGTITLDVFGDNARARSWYASLGFTGSTQRGWWDRPIPPPSGGVAAVAGLPQADLCHRAFGFSEVTLHTAQGVFRVGRLGAEWFRLTDLAALDDPQVASTLNALDDHRRVLAMGVAAERAASRLGPPDLLSNRLHAPVNLLRHRLTGVGARG